MLSSISMVFPLNHPGFVTSVTETLCTQLADQLLNFPNQFLPSNFMAKTAQKTHGFPVTVLYPPYG
jgi:hypothetical protein